MEAATHSAVDPLRDPPTICLAPSLELSSVVYQYPPSVSGYPSGKLPLGMLPSVPQQPEILSYGGQQFIALPQPGCSYSLIPTSHGHFSVTDVHSNRNLAGPSATQSAKASGMAQSSGIVGGDGSIPKKKRASKGARSKKTVPGVTDVGVATAFAAASAGSDGCKFTRASGTSAVLLFKESDEFTQLLNAAQGLASPCDSNNFAVDGIQASVSFHYFSISALYMFLFHHFSIIKIKVDRVSVENFW